MNNDQFRQWCQDYSTKPPHFKKPLIMGILNVTPDSFSDGGQFILFEKAIEQAQRLIREGADLLDIGGESSRPGAVPVSIDEELERVIPLIEYLKKTSDICISIDTYKAQVMEKAVHAGAGMINDITALGNEEARQLVARLSVPVCLVHMQGQPATMQLSPYYTDNVEIEINQFFNQKITNCLAAGIKKEQLILDPGFGFGKTDYHNLRLVNHLSVFKKHGLPVLIGLSRKNTIGVLLKKPANERLIGSLTLNIMAALNGVSIIRTHDVDATKQALHMVEAVQYTDNKD